MHVDEKPSRVAAARARAAAAKRALVVGAVCAFGWAMLFARLSHPASAAGSTAGGSIAGAPSFSQPQVRTGSS